MSYCCCFSLGFFLSVYHDKSEFTAEYLDNIDVPMKIRLEISKFLLQKKIINTNIDRNFRECGMDETKDEANLYKQYFDKQV